MGMMGSLSILRAGPGTAWFALLALCYVGGGALAVTVNVSAPAASCLSAWTSGCNPIQDAITAAKNSEDTVIQLGSGIYFNENFNSTKKRNKAMLTLKNKNNITIEVGNRTTLQNP